MSTKIEWCDDTWNPWWGCTKIAEECEKCYAAIFAGRGLHVVHAGVAKGGEWTGLITRSSAKVWDQPYRWRKPMLIFTCSMSDFWHEAVPLKWLDEALDVIEATPHITYLILSKRPGNAGRKLAALGRRWPDNAWAGATIGHPKSLPLLKPLLRIPAEKHFLSRCWPRSPSTLVAPHGCLWAARAVSTPGLVAPIGCGHCGISRWGAASRFS
jgi:protein gp37